ncbi:hypothetical protein DL765_008050 [Monosporascus sp. GIB2]|nr:hypothetical protein DL765_008050 [Monosporascus sp. GIB2]
MVRKLNADAIGRILAKLERYGLADSPTYRNIQSRWQSLQPAWETNLFDRLSRLARLIADISSGLALPDRAKGRSLYLAGALRQSPWPQASANALQQPFLTGDADPVIQLLISNQTKQDVLKQSSLHLVRDLLKFTAVRAPAQYETLLVLLPSSERLTIEQDAFKWWTTAIGRRRKLNFSSRTTEVYRKYALSNTEVRDRWASQAPQTKDRFGRLLLHHASSYGLLEVCQELIQKLPDSPTDANAAVQAILSTDNEGLTPLHLAVMGNYTLAASRGEVALHVAAQVGRVDYTTLVLQAMSEEGTELDVPNTSRGWTPLFFACANGHYDIVQLLLRAGLSQERTDCLGWTAKEYAVFKGHLVLADLFETPDAPRSVDLVANVPRSPLLVGHRGAGQNVKTHEHLQIGENALESFLSAAKLGASFVEFDIQITRDLKAVAFHDFSLSESGTDVPIHGITLDQFLHASHLQSPHGNPFSVPGKVHSGDKAGRSRSRSLDGQFEAGAVQIRDRMKHTVDFKQKGFKPNTRGDFIQDSFATLKEILVELPQDIGCDIEIKYPRVHEAVDAGVAPVAIEINSFVDIVLEELHRYGGERHIILSSFTPETCILLAVKQKVYPVFFITYAGKAPMSDMEVRAASLQVAVHFARRWNLAGVVFACEPLLLCPRLVGFVKARGWYARPTET